MESRLLNKDLNLLRTPLEEKNNGYLLVTDNYIRTSSSTNNNSHDHNKK